MILAVHPVLGARDVPLSVAFYERLGFALVFLDSQASPRYAAVSRDGCELHLQWQEESARHRSADRPTFRFLVAEVDRLFEELRSSGVAPDPSVPASPWALPGDTPWGTREFHVRDPAGNGLQFYRPADSRDAREVPDALPCLDLLKATPSILRGLISELHGGDARWKPGPDRFSVAEVLAHLSHSEGRCYRMRLDRFLAESRPGFEPDDAQMYLDLYRGADSEDAFRCFEEQREANVAFLRGLPAGAGERVALHREYGEITLAQMLQEWALHDLGHVRQVAELVRARKHLAGAGAMGAS